MSDATGNYEKQIKFYASAEEAKQLKTLAKNAKFKSVGDYLRHCVELEAAGRGEEFKFQPRDWNGYREPTEETSG